MTSSVPDAARRWVAAAGGAAIIVCAVVLLFGLGRVPQSMAPADASRAARVEKTPVRLERPVTREETMLVSLTPLFLPTSLNASPKPTLLREPGDTILDVQPTQLTFADTLPGIGKDLPPVAILNGKLPSAAGPLDLFGADAPVAPFFGFGRRAMQIEPMKPRGALLEVMASGTGEKVFSASLSIVAKPPTDQLWQPLELSAVVAPEGLAAPLTVSTGSRVEEVDNFFKNYLASTYRIGERLRPGFYRITVAP